MKGFLRQDLYHLALNAKFSLVFLVGMGFLVAMTDMNAAFFHFYLVLFSASSLLSLFNYDAANHWQSYAAAVPGGRKAQVDGRYLLALLAWAAVTALVLALSLLPGPEGEKAGWMNGGWLAAIVMGAIMLLYVDLVFPLNYRFGPRSRVVFVILIAIVGGGIGVVMANGDGGGVVVFSDPVAPTLILLAAGLALMPVSYAVSRVIVARKEG